MKLSDIREMVQKLPNPSDYYDPQKREALRRQLGIEHLNLYQELEMGSAYVDAHMDVSLGDTQFQFHSHRFYELICCRNTCGAEYVVGTERYKLQKGDIILVPPNTSHRPVLPEQVSEPYARSVMWLSDEFIRSVAFAQPDSAADFASPMLFRTAGSRWEYLCEFFHNSVRETERQVTGWETIVIANALIVLTHLRRAREDMSASPLRAEKPELVEQVLAYVEQHLGEKITLADISRQFYISESTITQTFRKKLGVSFYRCVTQRRLISAKSLIEQGLPMEMVAEHVGFTDYSAFFRAFKQEYGISPRQYRKMQTLMEIK